MTSQYAGRNNTADNVTVEMSTSPDPLLDGGVDYKTVDMITAIVGYCLCVVIVVLNAVVIVTLLRRRKDRNRLHFFILHLAIADILVGLVAVLGDAIIYTLEMVWHGGDVLCRIYSFAALVVLCASNNLLIGMSTDRFLAVKYPLKVMKIGNKMGKGLVLGAWLLSGLLSVFYLAYSKGDNNECFFDFPQRWIKTYMTVVAVVVYILPTVVIVVCYTGICIVIWKKWRDGLRLSETSKLRKDDGVDRSSKDKQGTGLLSKAKIKSIQMTLVICVAFFVCWTPYFVSSLLGAYHSIDPHVSQVFAMLYPLNSAANPLIFFLFNRQLFCSSDRRSDEGGKSTETQNTVVNPV